MKVLWITNILFPEVKQLLTGFGELKASGGWMLGAADALLKFCPVDLHIATVYNGVNELKILKGRNRTYYLLPYGKGNLIYNIEYESYWKQIERIVQPDVVHIHGTEYTHGLAYVKACGSNNVVVSIQGLKSEIAKFYCAGITKSIIRRHITFRDLFRGSILSDQKKFRNSGKYEVELLKSVKHIIGRTSWDKSHTWAINPDVHYYKCNEILRHEFYDGVQWNYATCIKHSIFLSQANYPLKGLHQVLLALPFILRKYPDTMVRIAGNNIISYNTLRDKLHLSGYGRYIRFLIHQLDIADHISFIGNLTAGQIKDEYLNTNLFICPSSIENSPNSLGEAQILGTPCIASYVGGCPDFMVGNEENLYRFEDVELLAEKVCGIFSRSDNQTSMISIATRRHDPKINSEQLYFIYQSIINA